MGRCLSVEVVIKMQPLILIDFALIEKFTEDIESILDFLLLVGERKNYLI